MRPVQIALQLIETLAASQPAGVSEIARLTRLPKSTAQRALTTLHKSGWVEQSRERSGQWCLTMKALIAAGRATQGQDTLRNVAIPVMEELRRVTGETIHLMVRSRDKVVMVERLYGILSVGEFRPVGSAAPLNLTATGRSILAALPRDELAEYLRQPFPEHSGRGITDPDALRAELARVRDRGYATAFGTYLHEVAAVAGAIINSLGAPFAAVSASGPLDRLTPERCEQFGPKVADAARRISMGIMWQRGGAG
jgi:IclR family acetate operon transcriptional repressor